jgi:radical SAM protein with 4Fe4S-binding SPASM domain
MGFEGFPYIIGWELTLACNLRCRHCASSAGVNRSRELTREESLAICDQFPALLVDEVVFTGGEPLLSPNWSAIADRLRELEIKTGMVTNGLPITDEVAQRMQDCQLTAAGISIDGPEHIHDRIRGARGVFRKTLRGIERLRKAAINITVITSITALNIALLDEIHAIVSAVGAWKWQLQPLFPLGRGSADPELRLSEADFLRMGEYIHRLGSQPGGSGPKVVPADSCGYFSYLDLSEYGWNGCNAGRYSCGIMSDGRVKGCLSWPDWTVEGDLRKDDLWSIWFRPGAFARLRAFTADDMRGPCRGCEMAEQCGGGCQAMSLATSGDWHADPYCYRRLLLNPPQTAVAMPIIVESRAY